MKTTLTHLAISALTLFLPGAIYGQTIKLSMNAGRPAISFNGKVLDGSKQVPVKISAGGSLTIQALVALDKVASIAIKDTGSTTPLEIDHLEQVFAKPGKISTDNKLDLNFNKTTYHLNQPFSIIFVSTNDNSKNTTVTFQPVQAQNPATPAADPKKGTKANVAYQPGSAVYDALKLSGTINENDFKTIMQLYFPKDKISKKGDALIPCGKNPFLKQIITDTYIKGVTTSPGAMAATPIISSASMSAAGGLDVTTVVDALAKFLVKRAKEELSVAFFQRLRQVIHDQPDLGTLFPKTTDLLGSIDQQGYDYKTYLQNLREDFKEDIASLDVNLPGILPHHATFFTNNPLFADGITAGSYFARELKAQAHPGAVIRDFPVDSIRVYDKGSWAGAVQTIQLLSESMRDTLSDGGSYWVNSSYLKQVINNKTALEIYLGLIYQQAINNYKNVPFDNKTSLITLLDKAAPEIDTSYDTYNAYKTYILQLALKAQSIEQMIKKYSKPGNDSLTVALYKKYFDASTDLVSYAFQVTTLPYAKTLIPGLAEFEKDYPPYLKLANSFSELAMDVNAKNYTASINQTVYIYNQIKTLTKDSTAADKPQVGKFVIVFTRYGSFMAAVATAKTSDDMETAIEAFVLPAGSSSVKRESPVNISLNAYTGLFLGHESIQGISNSHIFNSYGLTAPIGISINRGERRLFNPWWGNGHSSFSLFISIIDIGAVAAYRFRDDTTSQVPKIQLKNILSPGAFLSIGIPKTPLSLNLGAQMGPNLRQIDNNSTAQPSADASNKIYWRYSVSLVVDIPLLNLYTKSR